MNKYIVPKDIVVNNAISVSQMRSFHRCRKQWDYRYNQKLLPRIDRPYLHIGRLVHAGFEAAMRESANCPILDNNYLEEIGSTHILKEFDLYLSSNVFIEGEMEALYEQRDLAIQVFARSLHAFDPMRWEVLVIDGMPAVELRIIVPCVNCRKFQGYIDLIAREKETGHIWQIDYKFKSSISSEPDDIYNVQNAIYQKMLDRIGFRVGGTIVFEALNIPETLPNVNKNGTISRAKIRCTWDTYAKFCRDNDQNPDDYADEMIPKLGEVVWYNFIRDYRNENTLNNIWKDVVQPTAYEIGKKKQRYLRNISDMTCNGCAYNKLCQAELRGYDTDFIRKADYMVAEQEEKK